MPGASAAALRGALAQLGEHLLCKQGVIGSIPIGSTRSGSIAKPMTWAWPSNRTKILTSFREIQHQYRRSPE